MQEVSDQDCRAVLECVTELNSVSNLDELATRMVELLPRLVSADVTGYNEVNPRRQRMKVVPSDPALFTRNFTDAFLRYQHEHPILQHYHRTSDGSAFTISDFLSTEEFERTGIYNEGYRPLGCQDQIAVTLASSGGAVVAMAFNRNRRSFSDRDRQLLNLLKPHLEQAYARTAALADLNSKCKLLGGALEKLEDAVVLVKGAGCVAWASDCARRHLRQYFPGWSREGLLPELVRQWYAPLRSGQAGDKQLALSPLVIEQGDRRLIIRRLEHAVPGRSILLLNEHCTRLSPQPLESLGLTSREASVLLWMAQGKTNPQIALILDSKPRTIQKHAENIFRKLNVETRAAAASRATEILLGAKGR